MKKKTPSEFPISLIPWPNKIEIKSYSVIIDSSLNIELPRSCIALKNYIILWLTEKLRYKIK